MEKAALRLVQWCCRGTNANPWGPLTVKLSRKQVQSKTHAIPELRFEDQKLTSFAGLFVFQLLFQRLDLKNRLRRKGYQRRKGYHPFFEKKRRRGPLVAVRDQESAFARWFVGQLQAEAA
jgi:hypothetical protein